MTAGEINCVLPDSLEVEGESAGGPYIEHLLSKPVSPPSVEHTNTAIALVSVMISPSGGRWVFRLSLSREGVNSGRRLTSRPSTKA